MPMLKEDELIGCSPCSVKKSVPSPTSRSLWSRTSPPRPSSRSRTRGCLTNCAALTYPAHCRPHRSARAADRNVGGASGHQQFSGRSCSQCLQPCWRRPSASATPSLAISFAGTGTPCTCVATHNTPPAFVEVAPALPAHPSPQSPVGRMLATKTVVHVTDLAADRGLRRATLSRIVAAVELGGIRTVLLSRC